MKRLWACMSNWKARRHGSTGRRTNWALRKRITSLPVTAACTWIGARGTRRNRATWFFEHSLGWPILRALLRSALSGGLEVAVGKRQEDRPVRRGSVAGAMLPERHVAFHERGFDGRKLAGPHIFFAQQSIDRTGSGTCQKTTLGVHPPIAVGGAGADEYRARSAQRDQLVGIHR